MMHHHLDMLKVKSLWIHTSGCYVVVSSASDVPVMLCALLAQTTYCFFLLKRIWHLSLHDDSWHPLAFTPENVFC